MTEIQLDANDGTIYPSRNYNDLRHVWIDDRQTERNQVDWLLTLRQVIPKKKKSPYPSSVPTVHSPREKPMNTTEPEQGPFMSRWSRKKMEADHLSKSFHTNEHFQNFAETRHLVANATTMRQTSGGASEINWSLNLRGSMSAKPDMKWKRYFQRSHQSFDMAQDNFKAYGATNISPQQKSLERSATSLPIATIRDNALKQDRWPGCEGTALNNWEHLVADKEHGHKSRNNIRWETTLREHKNYLENLGSRVADNRSEGCVTEMLGKKKWHFSHSVKNDLALPYNQGGDPKLHHIQPVLGEPDDHSLTLRRNKQKRRTRPEQ